MKNSCWPVGGTPFLQHAHRDLGHRPRPGWGAYLVVNDREFWLLAREVEYRGKEVFSPHAVDPAQAQDEMRASRCRDGVFSGDLTSAIDADRVGCIVLFVGAGCGS